MIRGTRTIATSAWLRRPGRLCREGLSKAAIEEFHAHVQTVNRFVVGALMQSDELLTLIRRDLRKLAPGTKVSLDEIRSLLPDVLKRDVMTGESADEARKRIRKIGSKPPRRRRKTVVAAGEATRPIAMAARDPQST